MLKGVLREINVCELYIDVLCMYVQLCTLVPYI